MEESVFRLSVMQTSQEIRDVIILINIFIHIKKICDAKTHILKEDINSTNCLNIDLHFEISNSISEFNTNFINQKSRNDGHLELTDLLSNVIKI